MGAQQGRHTPRTEASKARTHTAVTRQGGRLSPGWERPVAVAQGSWAGSLSCPQATGWTCHLRRKHKSLLLAPTTGSPGPCCRKGYYPRLESASPRPRALLRPSDWGLCHMPLRALCAEGDGARSSG